MVVQQSDRPKTTTIALSIKTRDELASFGAKDDSFEDIIKKLIVSHRKITQVK